MSDEKKATAAGLGAAISMLGLSLGVAVTGAEAQRMPGMPPSGPAVTPQTGGTQGVLIALDQPGSQQWKSEQYKSQQYKSEQLKSQQLKSQQIKLQSQQVKLAPGQ